MEINKLFSEDFYTECSVFSPYPMDDINPKLKDEPAFALQFCRALWSEYCLNNATLPFNSGTNQMDYTTLRLYAQGNQPVEKYKEQLRHKNPDAEDSNRVSYESISWDNDSVIPRFRDSIVEALMGMDIAYSPQGVDEASMTEKTYIKNYIWEKTRNGFYKKIYESLGLQEEETLPFIPQDMKELEMYASFGLQLSHELKMKKVCDSIFKENEWSEEIKRSVIEDLVDLGICATYEGIDNYSQRPKLNYVDMNTLICGKSMRADYKDIETYGSIEFLTVNEVRKAMKRNGDFKSESAFIDQIKKMVNMNPNTSRTMGISKVGDYDRINGQDVKDSHGLFPYDYYKVATLKAERKSWNTDKITEKMTSDGSVKKYYENFDYNKKDTNSRKTIEQQYDTWYKGVWVIGTDLMVNWGQKEYIKRNSKGIALSGFTVYRATNKSMVATMIPTEDKLELMVKKYMFAWKRASPAGFAVYEEMLKGMKLGRKQTLHPFEVLGIQQDTGVLFLRSRTAQVGGVKELNSRGQPFSPIPGGLGNILTEYIAAFNFHMQQLTSITGIGDSLAGGNPEPYQLKSVTEMSFQGSLRRIGYMFRGYCVIKRINYEKVILDIQMLAKNNKKFISIFSEFGSNTVEKITVLGGDANNNYELRAEIEATEMMKEAILSASAQSFGKGAMSQSDYLQIVRLIEKGEIRLAQELCAYKEQKMIQIQQEINKGNMEGNAKAQQDSLMMKAQQDVELLKVEGGENRLTEELIGKQDLMLEQLRILSKEKIAMDTSGREK